MTQTNSQGIKDVVKKAFATIMSVRNDRIDLNEMMKDAREMMENAGVSNGVFSMAQKYLMLSATDREAFDAFFGMIKDVLDEEFQPSLFEAENLKKKELAKARKEKNAPEDSEDE